MTSHKYHFIKLWNGLITLGSRDLITCDTYIIGPSLDLRVQPVLVLIPEGWVTNLKIRNSFHIQCQSEYQNSPVFKWLQPVWMLNGPAFGDHLENRIKMWVWTKWWPFCRKNIWNLTSSLFKNRKVRFSKVQFSDPHCTPSRHQPSFYNISMYNNYHLQLIIVL